MWRSGTAPSAASTPLKNPAGADRQDNLEDLGIGQAKPTEGFGVGFGDRAGVDRDPGGKVHDRDVNGVQAGVVMVGRDSPQRLVVIEPVAQDGAGQGAVVGTKTAGRNQRDQLVAPQIHPGLHRTVELPPRAARPRARGRTPG